MKKLMLSTLITCTIIHTNISFCMLTEWEFKPLIQVQNPAIIEMRKKLDDNTISLTERIKINPHITIIGNVTADEEQYRCAYYAIKRATGCTEPFSFVAGDPQNTTFNIHDFFTQTPNPKKNDVIVYTTSEIDLTINHFAIFINNCTAESKWGSHKKRIRHRLFDLPLCHGNAAGFFTPQAEYTTELGKILMRMKIQLANNALTLYYQKKNLDRLNSIICLIKPINPQTIEDQNEPQSTHNTNDQLCTIYSNNTLYE